MYVFLNNCLVSKVSPVWGAEVLKGRIWEKLRLINRKLDTLADKGLESPTPFFTLDSSLITDRVVIRKSEEGVFPENNISQKKS